MECRDSLVSYLSWTLVFGGVAFLLHQVRQNRTGYGRYSPAGGHTCPAKLAWFLQEVPAFLVPLLLLLSQEAGTGAGAGARLPLFAFLLHYFHRSGEPVLHLLVSTLRPTEEADLFLPFSHACLVGARLMHEQLRVLFHTAGSANSVTRVSNRVSPAACRERKNSGLCFDFFRLFCHRCFVFCFFYITSVSTFPW